MTELQKEGTRERAAAVDNGSGHRQLSLFLRLFLRLGVVTAWAGSGP